MEAQLESLSPVFSSTDGNPNSCPESLQVLAGKGEKQTKLKGGIGG